MSAVIHHEILFFLLSVLSGILILCAYDQIRVLRRVIRHNSFFQSAEDFLFWTLAGIFCFGVTFRGNSGSIRGFSLAAIAFGMWFYHETLSTWIVKSETFVFRTLLYPIRYVSKKMFFLWRKALKKAKEWGTIIDTRKQGKVNRGYHETKKKKRKKKESRKPDGGA